MQDERREPSGSRKPVNNGVPTAGGRSKEELLAIRKAMMKPSGLSKKNTESSVGGDS